MGDAGVNDVLRERVATLESERALLERELGRCDARGIVQMVRSLEAQLSALYEACERAGSGPGGADAERTLGLLDQVQEIAQRFDALQSEQVLTIEVEGGRPVLRIHWQRPGEQGADS